MSSALLITGSINIYDKNIPNTKLTNLTVRLEQYTNSIEYAIRNYKNIDKIIFIDNTAHNWNFKNLQLKAQKVNKQLEIISFLGDYSKILTYGKGYGEGELIEYALNNSHLLNEVETFYKLTGRLVIKNINKINCNYNSNNHFIFYREGLYSLKSHVSTVFYHTSKEFYKEKLLYAYKNVNDDKNIFLENVFYDFLKNEDITSFNVFPLISGISGSTGLPYNLSKTSILIENAYNRLGLHDSKMNYLSNFLLKNITNLRNLVK